MGKAEYKYSMTNDIRKYLDLFEAKEEKVSLDKLPYSTSDLSPILSKDNVEYQVQSGDTSFVVEIDHYTVPAIEVGDNVQISAGQTFPIINTSYDPASASYNGALTANSVFRVEFGNTPQSNLAGVVLTNISPNPTGTINNVS